MENTKKIKAFFIDLLKNPGKAFIIAALVNICALGIVKIFVILGLPEMASEANNLSQSQVWTGFLLGIVRITLNLMFFIFNPLFTISLFYFMSRIIRPVSKTRSE